MHSDNEKCSNRTFMELKWHYGGSKVGRKPF